ncbi:unnamed protein product [Paramecium octaurelia]|uniref:Transmembrane protein n=1 Tax=Paramecium octaurelia TaxID=43137 RepID=A0A8S1YLJ8_PAROT|nr:unnamed protein product [Paramecium octaurelia]
MKIISQFFALKTFIYVLLVLPKLKCCSYSDYEDALLPLESPSFNQLINFEEGISFEFGFWSLCVPQQRLKDVSFVDQEFEAKQPEDGQFLFLIKEQNGNSMIGFITMSLQPDLVIHKITISGQEQTTFNFNYDPIIYEGKWILNVFSYNFPEKKIYFEMTDQAKQSWDINSSQIYTQIFLGGRGLIEKLNLNSFKGRLSKILIKKVENLEETLFQYLNNYCQIPFPLQGEQKSYLVKGLQVFDGETSHQYTINQFGTRYCLSGWIKYDASRVIEKSTYPLIRISLFKNYFQQTYFGDEIFVLQAHLNKIEPRLSQIEIYNDFHMIPVVGKIGGPTINYSPTLFNDGFTTRYFEGLQQWHYLHYEQGSTSQFKTLLYVQFFNELNLQRKMKNIASTCNSPFYLYLGSDEFAIELLQASLYDFKFEYNYMDDKQMLFNACHYSCQTCDGPLENNCVNCQENVNRHYLVEQKKCKCKHGYIDIPDEKVCRAFEVEYSSVYQIEGTRYAEGQCEFGYFLSPNENHSFECKICPQSNSYDILCVDCIYYPLTWYLKPICKHDLISQKYNAQSAFEQVKRDEFNYDFYLIDLNNVITLHQGFMDFCDIELDSSCFKTKYLHLGKYVNVKCKPNYYSQNEDCIFTNINCLLASSDGNCLQTKIGIYQYNNYFYECPLTCLTCEHNADSNSLKCQSCLKGYALDNGECVSCGNFCAFCQKYHDSNTDTQYLRCLKCLDDSKYFLSFDGINCFENKIQNCHYAFQALSNDFQVNTLDLNFTPRNDWQNIITTCGRCHYSYVLIMETNICLLQPDDKCFFLYAENFSNSTIFDEFTIDNLLQTYYVEKDDGELISLAFDPNDFSIFATSIQYCMIHQIYTESIRYNIVQFNLQCPGYIENCETCIREKVTYAGIVHICLICNQGYYADRISGKCFQCPSDLNCQYCTQQQKLLKDAWKIYIRAFYQLFINSNDDHPFKLYAQSEVQDDYEIICTFCRKGYELVNEICIKACPDSCLECQYINGRNQCIRCQLEYQGRKLSLSENECIECPQNCALCRIRSQEEIQQINPFFNNDNYITHTYQCLQSFEDQDYYFDQQLGGFIDCINVNYCEKQLLIPINLFCSQSDFINALNEEQTDYNKEQFKKSNIILEDLVSGSSFKEFENNHFYFQVNSKMIKTIVLQIKSVKPQTCKINGNATIQQIFSQNIFSAINVELQINFNQNTIVEFERTVTFQNFRKISILGGIFQPLSNNYLKQLIFQSLLPQVILIDSFKYQQISQKIDQSQLIFQNVSQLNINNFKIINLIQNNIDKFIQITNTPFVKLIKFQNFEILNSILNNQITLFFYLNNQDIIDLSDLYINAQFANSTFIETGNSQQNGDLTIKNINFKIDLLNCLKFMSWIYFNHIVISGISIINSIIDNSTLIILNNYNSLKDLTIKDNQFKQLSYGVINSNQSFENNLTMEFTNIILDHNEYDQTTKLICFNKYNNAYSFIKINNLIISSNFATSIDSNFNLKTQNLALMYIQLDEVYISNINIYRGYGLKEISIQNAKVLRLISSKITQSDEHKFLGLHQYLDCQLQQVQGQYYLQSLFITSVIDFEIIDMQIRNIQSYNSPVIYYKSSDSIAQSQLESIRLVNFVVDSNLLLLSNSQFQTAIIFIESIQQTILEVKNVSFIGNILHEYVQNNLQISSLLLNFNCILGFITITNSHFSQNTLYNSTDNLIFIKSQQLKMTNNTFYQNSYFNYQYMQPFLLWGFGESEKVSYQQINSIFQVKSNSGVGQFKVENLEIKFCHFEQSAGYQGGALYIEAQRNSIVTISETQFKNISTLFSKDLGQGGSIYLDGTTSETLNLSISQLTINDISAKENGGFIYIKSDSPIISISIIQLYIRNIYSKLGSFIYVVFSTVPQVQQIVKLDSIFIQNTQEGFMNYLNQYTQLSNSDQLALINNRALFYFDSVINLIIQNMDIYNIFMESAVIIKNAQIVAINNFTASHGLINDCLLRLNQNLYESSKIQINNLEVQNISIVLQLKNYNCEQSTFLDSKTYSQCISNFRKKAAPLKLQQQSTNQYFSYGNCIISQIQEQYEQEENVILVNENSGLLLFLDLTDITQLKLNNLIFSQINCRFCQNGLIFYQFLRVEDLLLKQQISSLKVTNSQCGLSGCFQITKVNGNRLLTQTEVNIQQMNLEVFINNYVCQYNIAQNGTCLFIENVRVLISNSIFQYNKASETGGAIFVKMKQDLLITSSVISHNSAYIGGGIYLIDQQDIDYFNLNTIVNNNQAQFFGENIISVPQKLTITIQSEITKLTTKSIIKSQDLLIQQVIVQQNALNEQQFLYLPSGQQISLYEYFSKANRTYTTLNEKFRVLALGKDNSIIKNLKNSYCTIDSRRINIAEHQYEQVPFSNNFTNFDSVYFNEQTQDYNLDDLIVYFDNELPPHIVLQLQFMCNSVVVANYNQQYPYNLLSTHQNYKLRINIKTLPCQFGEIKNYTDYSCTPCDNNQGLFSITLNSQKCELKDEISTISVKSALLNLKFGYWRPYFQSNLVSYCLNLPENCLGGWLEGDESCFTGHIGALCEQCDLYNIRGHGQYSISSKYSCGLCTENNKNIIIITLVSIWTLISILISVQSTIKAIQEFVRNFCFQKMGLAVNQTINQSAILIKMLTNYLQIISSIGTFQLKLPIALESTVNAMGSPIQAMTYSLDCFLQQAFQTEIQYARMIWQIIMPSIYISVFLHGYLFLILRKHLSFNICVITTTFIYMYIYLQPSVIGGFVQLISYREISGYKWIQSNVSQRYDTSYHEQWMLRLCFPLLFIFAIFIPIYFFYGLYHNSEKLDQKKVRLQWGYLYNEYTKSAYFWEVIKIAQKELMIIFLTYYDDRIIIKATIILLITGLYLELNKNYKPYKQSALNQLDCYSTNVCLASIVLAIGIYISQQSNSIEIQIPYQIIIIILNIHVTYLLISKIVVEYFKEKTTGYQDKLDIVRQAIRKRFPSFQKIEFLRRVLKDRNEQRIRIKKNYLKLRGFLIPLAKEMILIKKSSCQVSIERNLDSNLNTNHLSLRSPSLAREGQQLIRNPQLAYSLNSSKNITNSYAFDRMQLIRVIKHYRRSRQNHQIQQTFDTNQYPTELKKDEIKDIQDE